LIHTYFILFEEPHLKSEVFADITQHL